MPRGKHNKTGYPWGVTEKERTQINVPKVIAKEAREAAIKIWEEKKRDQQNGCQLDEKEVEVNG